jgi:hypothetical protein
MAGGVSRHRVGLAIVRVDREHGGRVVTVDVRVVDDVGAPLPAETELVSGDIDVCVDGLRDWLRAWAPAGE